VRARGVARTFQVARTFTSMTALDNVLTAALLHRKHLPAAREQAYRWLDFVGLTRLAQRSAGTLTISEQRRLAVARRWRSSHGYC